jgi:hypothetical protein
MTATKQTEIEQIVTTMFFPPVVKACSHDFVAPEGKPEHVICGTCGIEPGWADRIYRADGTMDLRYLPVRDWVDIALKCVKVG